jgi:hypothetical protein
MPLSRRDVCYTNMSGSWGRCGAQPRQDSALDHQHAGLDLGTCGERVRGVAIRATSWAALHRGVSPAGASRGGRAGRIPVGIDELGTAVQARVRDRGGDVRAVRGADRENLGAAAHRAGAARDRCGPLTQRRTTATLQLQDPQGLCSLPAWALLEQTLR